MNVSSYIEHILALLQRPVLFGVAVAIAYYFPNGAPLSRAQTLSRIAVPTTSTRRT